MDDAAQAKAQTLIKLEANGHRGDSYLTRNDLCLEIETRDGITQVILLSNDNKTSYRSEAPIKIDV